MAFLTAPLPWLLGSMERVAAAALAGDPAGRARWCGVVRTRVDGPALNGALARTGALQLVFCLLYSAGILASGGIGALRLELERRTLQAAPSRCETSYGAVAERELLIVALSDDDGVTGYGEAAPLRGLRRRQRSSACWRALEAYAPVLERGRGLERRRS